MSPTSRDRLDLGAGVAGLAADLLGVGRLRITEYQHQVAAERDGVDRAGPIGRRVAEVCWHRGLDGRVPRPQRGDDRCGRLEYDARLHQVRDLPGVADSQRRRLGRRLDDGDVAGCLTGDRGRGRMTRLADQHELLAPVGGAARGCLGGRRLAGTCRRSRSRRAGSPRPGRPRSPRVRETRRRRRPATSESVEVMMAPRSASALAVSAGIATGASTCTRRPVPRYSDAACRAVLAACSAPLHQGLAAISSVLVADARRPFVDGGAGRSRRQRVTRCGGGGDRCGAAVLLLAGDEVERGVKVARGIVAAGNLGHPHLAALGAQRAGDERSSVADQHAVQRIADLSRHQHLAALHADAGYLNLTYG